MEMLPARVTREEVATPVEVAKGVIPNRNKVAKIPRQKEAKKMAKV